MRANPVPVVKDENDAQPIPSDWRDTFCAVVDAFKHGDVTLDRGVEGVAPISAEDAKGIMWNLESYGGHLASLPEKTWGTSVCQWQVTYWDVLVDLFTEEEGAVDLVLFARVFEKASGYRFEIVSVHVP